MASQSCYLYLYQHIVKKKKGETNAKYTHIFRRQTELVFLDKNGHHKNKVSVCSFFYAQKSSCISVLKIFRIVSFALAPLINNTSVTLFIQRRKIT